MNAGMSNLSAGDYLGALNYALNNEQTIPFGLFFILLGIVIAAMVYEKSRSLTIVGIVWTIYTFLTISLLPEAVQPYFTLMLGIILTISILNLIKNRNG